MDVGGQTGLYSAHTETTSSVDKFSLRVAVCDDKPSPSPPADDRHNETLAKHTQKPLSSKLTHPHTIG